MEFFVHGLSSFITKPLNYNEEQRSVVEYGLYAIIQLLFIAVIITLFGLLTDSLWECSIAYFSVAILRKSTGGFHAKTSNGCLIASVIGVSTIGFCTRYITALSYGYQIGFVLTPFCLILACIFVYKLAPVGSSKKPINRPEKIKRLRRQSFIILTIYVISALFLLFFSSGSERLLNLAFSLSIATLWQSITLVIAVLRG